MRYIFIFALLVGCGDPGVTPEVNDAPVLESYHGIADGNGEFSVPADVPPIVSVWCTDLSGIRRSISYDYMDGYLMGRCEPGGGFEVYVIR